MKHCERCGIDEDDPRAQQACASVESESPYHRFSEPAIDYEGIAAKWDRLAEQLEQLEACELCCTSPCVCSRDWDGRKVRTL